jgi:hypothetical protein
MDKVLFSIYYLKLRVEVMLGRHKTAHPLNIRWRWEHWQRTRGHRNARLF